MLRLRSCPCCEALKVPKRPDDLALGAAVLARGRPPIPIRPHSCLVLRSDISQRAAIFSSSGVKMPEAATFYLPRIAYGVSGPGAAAGRALAMLATGETQGLLTAGLGPRPPLSCGRRVRFLG
jgi:hypothetical protein